jgi:hypothetical protein
VQGANTALQWTQGADTKFECLPALAVDLIEAASRGLLGDEGGDSHRGAAERTPRAGVDRAPMN